MFARKICEDSWNCCSNSLSSDRKVGKFESVLWRVRKDNARNCWRCTGFIVATGNCPTSVRFSRYEKLLNSQVVSLFWFKWRGFGKVILCIEDVRLAVAKGNSLWGGMIDCIWVGIVFTKVIFLFYTILLFPLQFDKALIPSSIFVQSLLIRPAAVRSPSFSSFFLCEKLT